MISFCYDNSFSNRNDVYPRDLEGIGSKLSETGKLVAHVANKYAQSSLFSYFNKIKKICMFF